MVAGLFRVVAVVAVLLAGVQPVLGSFAFFRAGEFDYGELHLFAGGLLYNGAIVLAMLAPLTRFRHRWALLGICVVLYGLTHLQLRLGLGSDEDASLLAFHIPLGVLIVLVTFLTLGLSFGLGLDPNRVAAVPSSKSPEQGASE